MPALLAASAGDGLLLSTHLMLPVTISGSEVSLESFVVRPDHPGRFPLVVITHGPRAWMAMRSSAISCTSSAIAWNKSGNETANPSSVRAELSSAANCARCKYRLTSQGADGRPDRRRFAGEQYRAMVRPPPPCMAQSERPACLDPADFRRTPGSSPSLNSIPAASKARRSLSTVPV